MVWGDEIEARVLRGKPSGFAPRHRTLVERAIVHAENGKPGLTNRANIVLLRHWLPVLTGADAERARNALLNLEARV